MLLGTLAQLAEAQAPGRISGNVVDEFRRPLGGTRVSVAGGVGAAATTDTLGAFTLSGVPEGAQIVRAIRVGYAPAQIALVVSAGASVSVTVVMFRDRTGADSIRVSVPVTPLDSTRVRPAAERAAVVRARQVQVTMTRPRVGSVIPLQLFDDFRVSLVVREVASFGPNSFRLSGEVLTPSGNERGIASLVSVEGRISGNVRIGPSLYAIRSQPDGIHTITEIDPERLRRDTVDIPRRNPIPRPPFDEAGAGVEGALGASSGPAVRIAISDVPAGGMVRAAAEDLTCSDLVDTGIGRVPEIRILAGYTTAARDGRGAANIEPEIAMAVHEAAAILRESGIRIDLTLVGMRHVPSDEVEGGTAISMEAWLDRLLAPSPSQSILDLRAARDESAADVTFLVTQLPEAGGLAYAMDWPRRSFADSAYAVVSTDGMNTRMSLAHELGHLLGGMHQVFGGQTISPRVAHSSPYRCVECSVKANGSNAAKPYGAGWITLMGLPRDGLSAIGQAPGYIEVRIPRFSNPDLDYNDHAAGGASGAPDAADHRETFMTAATTVAAFRMTPAWFVSASANAPWAERMAGAEWTADIRLAQLDKGGLADAFRVDEITGEWWWAKDTRGPWERLNPPDAAKRVPLPSMRFADFNGDGIDDAFWIDPMTKRWRVSQNARAAAADLNALASVQGRPIEQLAFGRFVGGSTSASVFWADPATGEWWIVPAGQGNWQALAGVDATRRYPTSALRFGDFDHDGQTDVFHAREATGEVAWRVYDWVGKKWRNLQAPSHQLSADMENIAVGEFDGDPGADVLVFTGSQWLLSSGGVGSPHEVMASCHRLGGLRIADVNGDGVLDILRSGRRP